MRAAKQKPALLSYVLLGNRHEYSSARFRSKQVVTGSMNLLTLDVEPDRQQLALVQEKPKIHFICELARVSGDRFEISCQTHGIRSRLWQQSLETLIHRILFRNTRRVHDEAEASSKS